MFNICATLCSTHVSQSGLFEIKSMFSVEMLYRLLDCIGKVSKKSNQKKIIERLYVMLQHNDCGDKLIEEISQRIHLLNNRYHWYQLIIWNNFFHAIFSFGDSMQWSKKRSAIHFLSKRKHNNSIGDDEMSPRFDNGLDVSILSLLYVDYLIKSRLNIAQRNYPLENKVIESVKTRLEYIQQKYLLRSKTIAIAMNPQESELFEKEKNSEYKNLFDKLCNVLSVFDKHCGDILISHGDTMGQFIRQQKNSFDAVFDLFERLRIYDIFTVENLNRHNKSTN